MTLLSYLRSHSQRKLRKEETIKLFEEAKSQFYDNGRHEWKVKSCFEYVNQRHIKPEVFILKLENLFKTYFEYFPKNLIGPKNLIDNLKSSRKFNHENYKVEGIPVTLERPEDINEFLSYMKFIKDKFLPGSLSNNKWVEIMNANFNTGYSVETLKHYYRNKTRELD